ncbi:hypothetical protein MSAN_02109100 [Mycena sanguinolenta]|uniref:Uncharacterized protein n=1 Tax=Mycena sanguinolenta TaxID=230812 RepID=A0A8H6XG21_9AGAR|nr:hypothetical protein MSAN_02109100 [Mycena sanguinolenta]
MNLSLAIAIFLFTKSDFVTILVPIISLAIFSNPSPRVPKCFAWTYLNLLQFCVSNQRKPSAIAEDAANKPWRPVPAGLISPAQAAVLRWTLLPACLAISWAYAATIPGITFSAIILLHNEFGMDSHWLTRSILNAAGYAALDWGATVIARGDAFQNSNAVEPQLLNGMIILTTIHAQDFRDELGDRVAGRRTIPTEMPKIGRIAILIGLPAWSIVVGCLFSSSKLVSLLLISMGTWVGTRFYLLRTLENDRASYTAYNFWLALARIVPVFTPSSYFTHPLAFLNI